MKLTAELTREFLETELPRVFLTLSRQRPFRVTYKNAKLSVFNGDRIINIHEDKLHNLIVDVLIIKSFRVSNYSSSYSYVSYLLPIIEALLSFVSENLDVYEAPYGGWKITRSPYSEDRFEEYVEDLKEEKLVLKSCAERIQSSLERRLIETANCEPELHYEHTVVFYATNREGVGGKLHFGRGRSNEMHYGFVDVSIPISHVSGKVERPLELFRVSLGKENKRKHITIERGYRLDKGEFLSSLSHSSRKQSVMLFIHGYNVNFNDAIYKSAQLKYDLNYEYPLVLFSWPSQGRLLGYVADKEQAFYSSRFLAELLRDISNLGIDEVLVLAHSMGSLCLAEAIKKLDSPGPLLSKLALAAPDIQKQAFLQEYSTYIKTAFNKVTLYASSKDKALLCSKYANSAVRLGDAGEDITVVDGVDTIDMSEVDNGVFSLNHSYISEKNSAMTDMHNFFINSIPARLRRLKSKLTRDKDEYWAMYGD
ncbi:alpha/beta hydrolase [Shewanella baltica]|uniref:alpha/beta hydrolase n=1 Tax=Shewanella baltica TaxID=62322 RepID=UPI003D7A4E0C